MTSKVITKLQMKLFLVLTLLYVQHTKALKSNAMNQYTECKIQIFKCWGQENISCKY